MNREGSVKSFAPIPFYVKRAVTATGFITDTLSFIVSMSNQTAFTITKRTSIRTFDHVFSTSITILLVVSPFRMIFYNSSFFKGRIVTVAVKPDTIFPFLLMKSVLCHHYRHVSGL